MQLIRVAAALSLLSSAVVAQDTKLTLGEPHRHSLETGDVHTYTVELGESHFVFGAANQHSVDVVVTVYGPDGEEIQEFDTPARGPESFLFDSDEAGVYRIEVTPFEDETGEYTMELTRAEPKATTPEGQVDQLLTPLDRQDTPGGVVAIVRDGKIIYERSFGMANLTYGIPFETDTRTNIGSTSKQFTAFAITLLAERGELSLDDDVRDHIPELPDLGETVTLRHLLTHTSGYREFLNTVIMGGRRLDMGDHIDRDELIEIVQRQPKLQNAPGGEWNYNNTGYGLCATIVERISGQSFPEWMSENVFQPLGMNDTFVRGNPLTIIERSSKGYVPNEDGGYRNATDLGGAMGAGGIYSTVDDLATWMSTFTADTHASIIEQMTTPFELTDGESTNYGLGLFIDKDRGLDRIHHGGADTAHRSAFVYYPELNAGVITQSNNAVFAGSTAARVAEAFFGDSMELEEDEQEKPESESQEFDPANFDASVLDVYAGQFEMEEVPGFVLTLTREDDQFFVQATGQPKLELTPTSQSTFSIKVAGVNLTFHREDDGSVDSLTVHQNGDHLARRLKEEAWSPGSEELQAYAGRYFSEELEAFYNATIEDGKLTLKHRRMSSIGLNPTKEDQFAGSMPIATVKFQRTDAGEIVAFLAGNGRTRGVRFERVAHTTTD